MVEATPVGARIVEQVAAREGVDPVDLDEQLYDVIDADALDALVTDTEAQQQAGFRSEFSFHGYGVIVDGSGRVTITEQPPTGSPDESASDQPADD